MTQDELIVFIDKWIRNSAVDAFTNMRLNTILKQLTTGSGVVVFDSYESFETLYTTFPDQQFVAIVTLDEKYGNDGVEYKYIPGLGVMLAGLELVEPIEDGN